MTAPLLRTFLLHLNKNDTLGWPRQSLTLIWHIKTNPLVRRIPDTFEEMNCEAFASACIWSLQWWVYSGGGAGDLVEQRIDGITYQTNREVAGVCVRSKTRRSTNCRDRRHACRGISPTTIIGAYSGVRPIPLSRLRGPEHNCCLLQPLNMPPFNCGE